MFRSILLWVTASAVLCAQPGGYQEQSSQTLPAFDVVAIRKINPASQKISPGVTMGTPIGCQYLKDRVQCQMNMVGLILEAYQVRWGTQFDSSAGADWMRQDIFSISATMPSGTAKETARLMLQRMLAERFGMKVHFEKRDVPVYAMLVGKHGPKLEPAEDSGHRDKEVDTPAGRMKVGSYMGGGRLFATASTLDLLALNLHSSDLDLPVVNMTGLTGEYRFDLSWTPEYENGKDHALVTEVLRQLGLRLEKRTLPYDVLVIDHVERIPTEN
jgi:uncharacterized protein (TIGR03435 family)